MQYATLAKSFGSIWLAPRKTMRELLRTNNYKDADFLFFLGGAGYNIIYAMSPNNLEYWGPFNFVIPLVIGGISGILLYNIMAALLTQTGKWFGGNGTMPQVKTALAWSMPPLILLIPLSFVALGFLMYGEDENSGQIHIGDYFLTLVSLFLLVATLLFFYLGINTVAVAHKQNLVLSGLSYLLAIFLLFSPFIAIFGVWALLT